MFLLFKLIEVVCVVCVLIFIYLFRLSHSACRILVPNQGLTLALGNEHTES